MIDFYKISQDIHEAFSPKHKIIECTLIKITMFNESDLIFRGQLLAKVDNLHVFKTDRNKYVCLNDDLIKRIVAVVSEENEIVNFFGFGIDAKKLYEKLEINKDLYIMDLTK